MDKPLLEQFREAVSAGEYQRASQYWEAYAAELLVDVRRGRGERLPEMREAIEWAQGVVVCARAQSLRALRTRLMEVHAAGAYQRTL